MTDSSAKARKPYQAHRENQRERILDAAEMLFIEHGIDNVSISDIAAAARISRVTLYEYFPNKEEVTWAIFQKLVQEPVDWEQAQAGTGYQRIEQAMMERISMLEKYPEHLRFIVEFNTLYAREGNPARVRQIVEQGASGGYDHFAQLIREGIADGSVRADLDPDLLSAALMNMLNALNSRFALLGGLIAEEYGHPVSEMYQEICRAFLRGIQNPYHPQEQK